MDALSLLKTLIAIPSINPMGQKTGKGTEREVADCLENLLRREGIEVQRQAVEPDRENIIARVDVSPGNPGLSNGLLLNSHMDTVPVAHMTVDPFNPTISQGRIFGRGSCDAKGSLAAMVKALIHHAHRSRRTRPVFLLATVDEEFSFAGSRKFIEQHWPISAAVVGEPTELTTIIAHKGVVRWSFRVWGVSAHGATPELGRNAIYDAAKLALGLQSYAAELARRAAHPLLGTGTLNLGRISGGQAVNMVADLCEFEVDRRLLPDEDGREAIRDCEAWLRSHIDPTVRFEVSDPFLVDSALDTSESSEIVKAVASSRTKLLGQPGTCHGAHYGTDGSKFSRVGIETIVCGPGKIAQAHTNAEFLEIQQLDDATRLYDDLIQNWGC